MSLQFFAAALLAGAAALWFLWGIVQDFKGEDGCASGCGTCSKRCPFQAPARSAAGGPGGTVSFRRD